MDAETTILAMMEVVERSEGDERSRALDALLTPEVKERPAAKVGNSPFRNRKMLKSASSASRRSPGQVWRGASGRYFTMTADHRVVPAKGPNGETGAPEDNEPKEPTPEEQDAGKAEGAARKAVLQTLLKKAGSLGNKTAEILKKLQAGSMRKMSPSARKKLRTIARYAAAVDHQLEKFASKTQNLVHEVVKESGMDPEDQKAVLKIVKAVDLGMRWVANIPIAKHALEAAAVASGGAGFALSKVGWYVPVASLAYLAGSTAVDPMATLRAAKNLLSKKGAKGQGDPEIDRGFVEAFVELYRGHDKDLVAALLSVAIDEEKDPHKAIASVEEALANKSNQPPTAGVEPSPFADRKSLPRMHVKEGFTGRRQAGEFLRRHGEQVSGQARSVLNRLMQR